MRKLVLVFIFFMSNILLSAFEENKHMFPLFKEEVYKRRYILPRPYGINFVYVDMKQNVNVESLNLTGKLFIGKIKTGELSKFVSVKSKVAKVLNTNKLIKADFWLFLFWNIYGILGKTKGSSSVNININLLNKPFLKDYNFTLKYEGVTYGIGSVIVGGYKNIFH